MRVERWNGGTVGWWASALVGLCLGVPVQAQTGATFDETRPPGENFDKAEFRLWMPAITGPLRAIVVLVPGSNGDGRPMLEDTVWQAFATLHHSALLGVRF